MTLPLGNGNNEMGYLLTYNMEQDKQSWSIPDSAAVSVTKDRSMRRQVFAPYLLHGVRGPRGRGKKIFHVDPDGHF